MAAICEEAGERVGYVPVVGKGATEHARVVAETRHKRRRLGPRCVSQEGGGRSRYTFDRPRAALRPPRCRRHERDIPGIVIPQWHIRARVSRRAILGRRRDSNPIHIRLLVACGMSALRPSQPLPGCLAGPIIRRSFRAPLMAAFDPKPDITILRQPGLRGLIAISIAVTEGCALCDRSRWRRRRRVINRLAAVGSNAGS